MLHLYDPTPDEGTIEVNSIIELMKALCFSPLEQSSITTESNITQTPLYQLLHGITTGNNDEKNPFKLYILEHDGHFILLDLKQTENGVEYGIYDSISYKPPKGKIREVRIKKILENIFHGQTVTHNQNQYIRIRQGTNHAIIDADNCGLTSVFAQFIFEQFGEDFPIDIFINNPSLYSRLNAIAQNMRGRQDINIDQVAQELTLLALEITENHLEQQQEDPSETFNLDQELEYMTQILTQCPHGQEEGLPYQLIAEFQEILKKSLINKGQINQQNIEAIKTLHDSFVMLYMHYRDEFLSSTQENAIKTIAGDSSAHSALDKEIQFSVNFINMLYFFHEIRDSFPYWLEKEYHPLGKNDPVIQMSQMIQDLYSVEVNAVGNKIDIKIFDKFDQAIELALKLANKNKAAYTKSTRKEIRMMIPHLNNQLLRYRMTRSLQGSGETATIDDESFAQAFAEYAANVGEDERNDHNIMGLLHDYAMNDNENSFMKFRSTLIAIQDDAKKFQYLQVAIEILILEASKRTGNFEKEAVKRFQKIYYLLTGEGLAHFIDQDPNLKFALILAKQSLYTKYQKSDYETSPEEVFATDPAQLSEFYSELYLTSISLTQDLEKSKIAVLNHLDRGLAEHCPTQESLEFYKIQSVFNFRDYFVYNEACPQHLFTNQAFAAAIQIHEKALQKIQDPEYQLGILNSLFKLFVLSTNYDKSKEIIERVIRLVHDNPHLNEKLELATYVAYLEKAKQPLESDQRVALIADMDIKIVDVEHDLIARRENELILQQHLAAFQHHHDHGASAAAAATPAKEYVLKIDGTEVDPRSLPIIQHQSTQYLVHCPEELLNQAGDYEEEFKSALAKNEFAKSTGDDGTKFICKNNQGTVYELKIKSSEARILGILTDFKDQNGNTVRLIHFSKYLQKTKDPSGRTNKKYNDTKDSLTPPIITCEEKSPGTAPAPSSYGASPPPRSGSRE